MRRREQIFLFCYVLREKLFLAGAVKHGNEFFFFWQEITYYAYIDIGIMDEVRRFMKSTIVQAANCAVAM